jgi:hypothetical protein
LGWPPPFLVRDGTHLVKQRGVIRPAKQAEAVLEYTASSIGQASDRLRFRLRRAERLEENILDVPEGAASKALLN